MYIIKGRLSRNRQDYKYDHPTYLRTQLSLEDDYRKKNMKSV